MRSVGLLAYSSVDNTVKEIACDFTTYWMNAVEVIDDETFIGAENEGNLFVLRKNTKGESDEERARLQLQGVHEFIRSCLCYMLPLCSSTPPLLFLAFLLTLHALAGDFHAGEYVNVFRRGTLIYNVMVLYVCIVEGGAIVVHILTVSEVVGLEWVGFIGTSFLLFIFERKGKEYFVSLSFSANR